MSLVVTGATGHLGRLVVDHLLAAGVPAADVVATGRRVERLDDLALHLNCVFLGHSLSLLLRTARGLCRTQRLSAIQCLIGATG